MSRTDQVRPLLPKPPKPTYEDTAERLTAPDEYLWTVRQHRGWGLAVVMLFLGLLLASGAVLYIGGRQFYTFSGYGAPNTHALRAYFKAHAKEGISLKQTAPVVPFAWPVELTKQLKVCLDRKPCRRELLGRQGKLWRANALTWFPELVQPMKAFWLCLGGLPLALIPYLLATTDLSGWRRWEQRERLTAGQLRREQQRRG